MDQQEDWLTIITVSFNSEMVLPRMLASVPKGARVVIVDNASTDRVGIRQIAADHHAELIELPENEGFGSACNIGAAEARTEFLLFLNPDVEIRPQALDALREAAARYPSASAFNPRILNEDGTTSLKRRSNLLPRAEWLPRGDGYCTLRSGNSFELRAMSPCWGAPQQGLPILVFHGVAHQPWRRANGQTEGYGG